jgi:hypothetical protein
VTDIGSLSRLVGRPDLSSVEKPAEDITTETAGVDESEKLKVVPGRRTRC